MTNQQLAFQALSDAQRILEEEYLTPRLHNNERMIHDRLVARFSQIEG
jgi:hypothetical protein